MMDRNLTLVEALEKWGKLEEQADKAMKLVSFREKEGIDRTKAWITKETNQFFDDLESREHLFSSEFRLKRVVVGRYLSQFCESTNVWISPYSTVRIEVDKAKPFCYMKAHFTPL